MGLYELFRDQRIQGLVKDKYRLPNNNLGLIIQEESGKRYAVEFQTNQARPCLANLYGLIDEPFRGKGQYLEHLIQEGDRVELAVGYRKDKPIKTAYGLYSVSNPRARPKDQGYRPQLSYVGQPPY